MSRPAFDKAPGPFRADQIRCGDPYELSNGHAIRLSPTAGRGAGATVAGAAAIATDPDAVEAGIDAGYSPEPGTLRAPDISVGNVPNAPGWIRGVPPFALEYADTGQDEDMLASKIADLLAAGTRLIWVVRLAGARRVEVHEPGKPMRVALPGEELRAPGVLRNPVRVEALYDRDAAFDAALRNLLQHHGYESLEQVREQGDKQGQLARARTSLRKVLAVRGLRLSAAHERRIDACDDLAKLETWLETAVVAPSIDEVLGG